MSDIREDALQFVANFIAYYEDHDILDKFDSKRNKQTTSDGVLALVKQARSILPRAEDGQIENSKLTATQIDESIQLSANIVDTREMFSRKVQDNGSARGLLEQVLSGDQASILLATEFIRAQKGEKEFGEVPTKI
jgi:hypothetical protein